MFRTLTNIGPLWDSLQEPRKLKRTYTMPGLSDLLCGHCLSNSNRSSPPFILGVPFAHNCTNMLAKCSHNWREIECCSLIGITFHSGGSLRERFGSLTSSGSYTTSRWSYTFLCQLFTKDVHPLVWVTCENWWVPIRRVNVVEIGVDMRSRGLCVIKPLGFMRHYIPKDIDGAESLSCESVSHILVLNRDEQVHILAVATPPETKLYPSYSERLQWVVYCCLESLTCVMKWLYQIRFINVHQCLSISARKWSNHFNAVLSCDEHHSLPTKKGYLKAT